MDLKQIITSIYIHNDNMMLPVRVVISTQILSVFFLLKFMKPSSFHIAVVI